MTFNFNENVKTKHILDMFDGGGIITMFWHLLWRHT